MITTLWMRAGKPRPPHVISTRRTGWRAFSLAGLLAATAVGAALLAATLSGHHTAQAASPGTAASASAAAGALDHSMLNNPALLPEPNAALLHSDPNEYVPARGGAGAVR